MKRSGWYLLPAAFFLLLNFAVSPVKVLYNSRLTYFAFLIFLFFLLRRFDLEKILSKIAAGLSIILFSYGFIQKFVLFPHYLETLRAEDNFYSQAFIFRIESGRIFSLFALPTLYSIICAVLVIYIFHQLLQGKGKLQKLFWSVLLVAGVANLLMTQSFGGVLCLSAGALVYLLLSSILKLKYIAPALMGLSLFLFIIVGLRFSEARELEPVKLRLSNWNQAIRLIEAKPFWGVGLGNYTSEISKYTRHGEAKSIYAHNFFLQFTAETGLIFSAMLLLFFILAWKKIKPDPDLRKKNIAFITIFLVLLLYNAIDIGFYFFSSGIIAVIALSRIYPLKSPLHGEKKPKGAAVNRLQLIAVAVTLVLTGSLLLMEAVSDNYEKDGNFFLSQKQYEEALQGYEKSLAFNPYNYKSLTGTAYYYYLTGDTDNALRYLDRSLALYPEGGFENYLKSRVEFKRRRFFSAFYHAAAAYRKNQMNKSYKQWYQFIRKSLKTGMNGKSSQSE
jgi:O-antigen ligase